MVENSNSSYDNEIYKVDSLCNEDSKNIIFFSREAVISGEGWSKNLCKIAQNREIYCNSN